MGTCTTCKGETKGWKCDQCGEEASQHIPTHKCGGDHCMPKCSGCGEAEVNCSC